MDLSIIIVSWNAKDFLLECLESIVSETRSRQAEIIVVDNASEDGSPGAVRDQFPQVKLICNDENLGFAKANNIGINESTGKYISLINSDVKVLTGCIDRMYSYMENHPSIGMLGPRILNPDLTLQSNCRKLPNFWNILFRALAADKLFPHSMLFQTEITELLPLDSASSVDVITGTFWMLRRSAINQVGLLDERFFIYAEDKDWCKRFHEGGWDVVYFPAAEAVHYGGASSANAPVRFYVELQKANLLYWKKHHSRPGQLSFLFINFMHQVLRIMSGTIMYVLKPSNRTEVTFKIKRSTSAITWLSRTLVDKTALYLRCAKP